MQNTLAHFLLLLLFYNVVAFIYNYKISILSAHYSYKYHKYNKFGGPIMSSTKKNGIKFKQRK